MRISVSSWATTDADVERRIEAMIRVANDCPAPICGTRMTPTISLNGFMPDASAQVYPYGVSQDDAAHMRSSRRHVGCS